MVYSLSFRVKTFLISSLFLMTGLYSPYGAGLVSASGEGTELLPPVVLEQLLQEAEKSNPDIRAAKAAWLAAKRKIAQAWALPDPMLGMDIMGAHTETRVGPQENRLMISQGIPFPLKLWKQRQAAKAEAEEVRQEYLAVKRDILTKLRQSFYELYFVDASLEVIQEVHGLLAKFENVAQARYANRQGEQRDVAKSQAEVSLTLEREFRLRQMRETLVARVNAICNRDPFGNLGKTIKPEQPEVNQTLVELINQAVKNRQEIQRMEARLKKTRYQATLAKLQNIPDVNVGFTYTWVGNGMTSSMEDGKDSWMIPVSVNVPLWQNRIVPSIQEAGQKVRQSEAELEGTSNQTFYEIKDAYTRFQTASKIALLYETAVIPQANLALKSDQAGYEAGTLDFLNLLDSERIYLNAQLDFQRVYTEILQSYADLMRATGLDFKGDKS